MSTQPITSSQFAASTPTVSSLGAGAPLQITGLASGLDTNAIIQALMAVDRQPVTDLTNQQKGLQALNQQLTAIQSSLQTVALNAQALESPALFGDSQSVTSTNPALVSATGPSSGVGAVVGGYQVTVSQLASAAQRTFTFTSPSSPDTITIDGKQISLAAGASIQDFVNAVNSNSSATVWATATSSSTVVLSDRATGNNGPSFIQVSDPGGALVEQTALAQQGQNASYTVNGVSGTSASNTVTGAIPGVTLTLSGVTTTAGPVTINVSPPAPNAQSILSAVQTFVTSYNSAIDQIQAQLTQKPVSGDPTQGTLFADPGLTSLLNSMRQAMYTPGAGLPSGMASMLDIGVSTGAASGTAAPSQSAIAGHLTVDTTALTNAIQSNPSGVEQVLQTWAQSFSSLVNAVAAPGGTLDGRIQGDSAQISSIGNQIDDLNAILADRQAQLEREFAQLEAVLSQNQSTSSWLTSQIAALPPP